MFCLAFLQSGDWVVLLEGLCRISVHGLASRPNQQYDTVHVQQLELQKPHNSSSSSRVPGSSAGSPFGSTGDFSSITPADPATAAGNTTTTVSTGGGASEQSAAELGKQLKSSTRHLLQLLSGQAGLPAARRLQELLDAVPPWRAADVVAAALARNSQVCCMHHESAV